MQPSTREARAARFGEKRRPTAREDMRVRYAAASKAGFGKVAAITAARRKLLDEFLRDRPPDERELFPTLLQRLADTMKIRQRARE